MKRKEILGAHCVAGMLRRMVIGLGDILRIVFGKNTPMDSFTSQRRQLLLSGLALPLSHALLPGVAHAVSAVGVSPGELVIGQSITLQNGKNSYGVEVLAGVQAYLQDLNASGGVYSRKVVLRTLDDDNQPAKAEANARKLVEEGAFVLFGSIEGGPSGSVMKVANELKVPFFGPMAGSPNLRKPYQPFVFPVRAEHLDEFRLLVSYAASIGLKRLAFFHADSPVGQAHLANLRGLVEPAKMSVVAALPFGSEMTDAQLDEQVKLLARQNAEVVLNHGSTKLYERLIRRIHLAGLKVQILAVNSGSTQLAAALKDVSTGLVFAQVIPNPWSGKTLIAREYQKSFAAKHPQREFSYGSLEGFLTAKALVAALKLAGSQPTRSSFVDRLHGSTIELGGFSVQYLEGDHRGSKYVDIALVRSDGKFLH
jgi:branched-chain amino acid transport system substrate-binding protein